MKSCNIMMGTRFNLPPGINSDEHAFRTGQGLQHSCCHYGTNDMIECTSSYYLHIFYLLAIKSAGVGYHWVYSERKVQGKDNSYAWSLSLLPNRHVDDVCE